MTTKIDNKARTIQEAANQLGWNEDVSKLIERVNQLDKGLVQEDEFIYIINWSGNCKLIHKLDQLQLPLDSKNHYTIPDILVEVETEEGNKKFLIEIKTSKKNKLSWTEKYYDGLKNYSALLDIPILIAWKWNNFGIWSLFEINHFSKPFKNYKIDFEKTQQENLMSKLFGDCVIIPYENFGLVFSMKKIKKISEKKKADGSIEIGWQTVMDEIYLTGKDNKKIEGFNKSVFAVLTSMRTKEETIETDTHLINRFVPHPNKIQFAQSVPTNLISTLSTSEINWLQHSKEHNYPIEYKEFMDGLNICFEEESIRNVLMTIPLSEK